MSNPSERRIQPWSVWALILIMVGGVPITYAWLKTVAQQASVGRPPHLRPVKMPLSTDDHRGEEAKLFAMDGQLYLVGYCYFGDHVEAEKVCKRLAELRKPFLGEKKLTLVAVSMAPGLDTTEVIDAFSEKTGFGGDGWLFVRGDRQRTRDYMNKWFRYPGHVKPDEYRETETDLYARELRISLVDGGSEDRDSSFIRGVYWEGIPEGELRNDSAAEHDIRFLLDEMNGITPEKEDK